MVPHDGTDDIKVLLVDDEQALRTLIRLLLRRSGQFVVVGEASNIDDAVRQAESMHPDVILLDLLLGTERGTDAIPALYRAAPTSMVTVLTAMPAEDEEAAVRAAGAFAFYEKTRLTDLTTHIIEDLGIFRRGIAGEDVGAPPAISRRR